MRDPIRRKLDEHAARHVPATTDLWPALRRRVAAPPGPGRHRRGLAGLRATAAGAGTAALALAILALTAVLLGPGPGRRAPVPAAAAVACPAGGPAGTPACRPDAPPRPGGAVAAGASVTPTVAIAAAPTPAYSIPTTPDPRYRAPDLPQVTPGAAHGIPWITPRDPGAAPGRPAIAEADVRAAALTAGYWPDEFRPVGPTTIASVEFLSHAEVEPRVGGHLEATAHDELCLVTLVGGFTRPPDDMGAAGPTGQPVTSQHLYLLFDARTGNFLMMAQPSPNMDK